MLKIRELQRKKQAEDAARLAQPSLGPHIISLGRISAAQIRLQKDITELDLPQSIVATFPDPADLFHFELKICPRQGFYANGNFRFAVDIGDNFPIDPPKIKCLCKIYHPNIDLAGNVCLNILREDWLPVLNLNLIIIGLNFLLLEPNANDPLNKDAANVLVKDRAQFKRNVTMSMAGGYIDGNYYDDIRGKR